MMLKKIRIVFRYVILLPSVDDFIYDFIYGVIGGLNASFKIGYELAEKYERWYLKQKSNYEKG